MLRTTPENRWRGRVQGLPLGSGLGSSAASAAAGAWAVNGLFGCVDGDLRSAVLISNIGRVQAALVA
jgi:homoserine kinase